MNGLSALTIQELEHSYQNKVVLNRISCTINSGEYVGLVGINGAGKSTLIKSVLDFVAIKQGSIEIYGKSHRMPTAREKLSFLPEQFKPPYYLKGKDFLQYMAELHTVPITRQDMEAMLTLLDLELSALDKPVRQYSKGMAQKLGLAACFLSKRPLLLLDEPMSGLDPKARAYLKKYLLSLRQDDQTLFFSTHLLSDIEDLCDRLIILHQGEIRFDGSPADCCDYYQQPTLEGAYMQCIE
ncbi:MAG: ABC transporter ATP-binding protein [Gammaproteobacteria bacterium]